MPACDARRHRLPFGPACLPRAGLSQVGFLKQCESGYGPTAYFRDGPGLPC